MSLVAYASSDSEQSDTEEQADNAVSKATKIPDPPSNKVTENGKQEAEVSGEISDSDSEGDGSNNMNNTSSLAHGSEKDINVLLKALPEPKYESPQNIEENDELEEEVKPKAAQIADAPKPPPKKSKQPVRITVPSLDPNSDEEDEPSRKKSKTSNSRDGKSGLFALLPAPVHAAKKETNRLLIPHTLTKKPAPKAKQKPQTIVPDVTSQNTKSLKLSSYSDSDEEDESPSSFFSLDSNRLPGPMPPDPATSIKTNKLNLPPPTVSRVTDIQTDIAVNNSSNLSLSKNIMTSDVPSMDAPLNFGPANQNMLSLHNQNASLTFKTPYQNVGPSLPGPMKYPQQDTSEMMDYSQYEEHGMESHDPVLPSVNEPEGLMQDEEFLRLQGKKQRGKEEINIIDVNADDFISTVDVHKSLSEEQTAQPSHKKKDGPTSQQKRKHQITYLAHQAKERELTLKNQWAQNRMTKRQTQAKYGF